MAEAAGRRQLVENLRPAAELAAVPEEEILRVYNALRPGRATPAELEAMAARLEREWGAVRCAALVREAVGVACGGGGAVLTVDVFVRFDE